MAVVLAVGCGGEGEGGTDPSLAAGPAVDRIAEEIHRGLVESVHEGAGVEVALGDGSEVLAAAWSAIAQVRAHLTRQSEGKVRFAEAGSAGASGAGDRIASSLMGARLQEWLRRVVNLRCTPTTGAQRRPWPGRGRCGDGRPRSEFHRRNHDYRWRSAINHH